MGGFIQVRPTGDSNTKMWFLEMVANSGKSFGKNKVNLSTISTTVVSLLDNSVYFETVQKVFCVYT